MQSPIGSVESEETLEVKCNSAYVLQYFIKKSAKEEVCPKIII